ncbi:YicC/YloC family endoribonuclease [Asticcacaulis excentricus]|uniref:YicC-like domain-containing protein n=1 Tax=Asticcacaulis excentricus (strain ATCC 15261 / DSM 4724 / KCTC 12464 / NCIMB 9791 / VKM B-1370 / CB 48) TaxID=573065 RepID=E8RSF9_ASTEC|nr:YicC/YloC family endoribonuclease [Asticcacaulis excentricus]ADU14430.1 YicC-like domain-containing protein [Asticcacaulis excentricus CB 48]
MTLSSMTGFGRVEGHHGTFAWVYEVRSVNGRSLDLKTRVPSGYDYVERAARDLVKQRFQRGQVSLNLSIQTTEAQTGYSVNHAVLSQYLEVGQGLMQAGQATMPSLDGLLSLRGVIEATSAETDTDLAALEAPLLADLGAALEHLKSARQDEGRALFEVLAQHLVAMTEAVDRAEALAAQQTEVIRERFTRRLNELLPGSDLQERVMQEAAVMAVKADVREELDRLRTHIASAHTLLSDSQSQGRKLDFLSQEFMREANTLCSKAAFSDLTKVGLELKSVIDQFREQVQNVE